MEEPKQEGTLSGDNDTNYRILFNNGCLQNTAYDTNGGIIRGYFRGLFSGGEVYGSSPTAAANAYVDNETPDVLVVESGRAGSHVLHFAGLQGEGQLEPMDQETRNVLATNGCEFGVVGHTTVDQWGDSSSSWIDHTRITATNAN